MAKDLDMVGDESVPVPVKDPDALNDNDSVG